MAKKGKLVVVTGPSGVGKSTILKEVLRRSGAVFSVSATTRAPRSSETEDRDYKFVDEPTFDGMVQRGEMLEWAEVYGQRYGTPARPVFEAIAAGQTVILNIDLQGAKQVHRKFPQAAFLLITPPNREVLAERLGRRGSENQRDLAKRLTLAREEIVAGEASGLYNHRVVNDDLEGAIRQVVDIIS